ncbi:MAG: SurA N-terminal domain-containing protein [Anaerolineae bacterium]|nr:SurA N-terminal domain-containing protein [Anaerolineae bacterium]
MSKKTTKRVAKELTRKQRSRLEREKVMERVITWGVIALTVLVVGILAAGLIIENVVKARQPVATVGGVPIYTADFQARVRFVRLQLKNQLNNLYVRQQELDPTDPANQSYLEYLQSNIRSLQEQLSESNALIIGEQTLEQMIQEELIRQEAKRRNITVSREELQETIEQYFGYQRNPPTPVPLPTETTPVTVSAALTPTATPPPTPTPVTEQEFQRRYDEFLKALRELKISERQYRSWIEASLLFDKVREQFHAEAPTTAEQVKLRYISVGSEEQAKELIARLDAGEDMQAIIDAAQQSSESEEEGGAGGTETEEAGNDLYGHELDWYPKSILVNYFNQEVADAAFTLEIGVHSQPIMVGGRYLIIEVLGREVRELDAFSRQQLGENTFQEWLKTQQEIAVTRGTYRDRVPTEPGL